jgi:hypothetical protein
LTYPDQEQCLRRAQWHFQACSSSATPCGYALEHVRQLERKAQALQQMSETLKHLADHCQGDDGPECPIIEEFANSLPPGAAARRRPHFGVNDLTRDRAG